jgi:predicted aspartyl protease
MMHGIVDNNCEVVIRLVVGNTDKQRQVIDAVIDTGFTGFLTLPLSVLNTHDLQAYSREEGTLGDGSTCVFDDGSKICTTAEAQAAGWQNHCM